VNGETQQLSGSMLIAGRRLLGTAGSFRAIDARSGAPLPPVYGLGSLDDSSAAAAAAHEAFPLYRRAPLEIRAALLEAIATRIDALGEVLIERATAETGLPEIRIRAERARTVDQLRLFARVVRERRWLDVRIDPADPSRRPAPRSEIRSANVPLGPVAVFASSNFPLAFSVAGGDTASALAAGCPVVVKAHGSHPGTSELVGGCVADAVAEVGLSAGVFSMLFGRGAELGIALVTDPRIHAVGFTGSREGGLALVRAAAERPVPIPVYAEMSSVNPVFLFPTALERRAAELAESYIASVTGSAGQLCTKPGLVFLVESGAARAGDTFVEAAAAALRLVPPAPALSPTIAHAYADGVARIEGETLAAARGAMPPEALAVGVRPALFVVDADRYLGNRALSEEVFGPASIVVRGVTPDLLPRVIEELEGQLTASLHADSEDSAVAGPALELLEQRAGRIVVNGWPTGVEVGEATVHGGPFPATSDGRSTSVGTRAIERFLRPVAYQSTPIELLPPELGGIRA